MVTAMRHRGPDDKGIHFGEAVGLGMTRLAIVDTSEAGHQPMAAAEGRVWIVFNGEIYNYREKREELQREGVVFRSGSDTEVILQLYLHYGRGFVNHLRGMFAVGILDKRDGREGEKLFVARDPLGIKPLLYSGNSKELVFASEMKAILASGCVERQVSPRALHGLLAYGSIEQPDTIIKGVHMLLPGHMLTMDGRGLRTERYWNLSDVRRPELRHMPYSEQVKELRDLLERTTKAHMVSDVPVGAFLSGGIDSTVLVALMARQRTGRLRTFSVGFGGGSETPDETNAAELNAKFLGTDHTRVLVTGETVRDQLTDFAAALDQPSVDGANTYFVSAATTGSVKVAISGTGGDEAFAGYPWFQAASRSARQIKGPGLAPWARRSLSGAVAPFLRRTSIVGIARVLSRIRASGDLLETFSRQYRIVGSVKAERILESALCRDLGGRRDDRSRTERADELPYADIVSRVSAMCLRGYLQNQLLRDVDAVSMAHSLEVRVPFVDTQIVDFALSLPDEAKLGRNEESPVYHMSGAKRILIDATKDLLPPVNNRHAKSGFSMPFDRWLRGPLLEILQDTTSPSVVAARGFFEPAEVEKCRNSFLQGRGSWPLPWLLMIIELWCREVLEKPSPVSTQ